MYYLVVQGLALYEHRLLNQLQFLKFHFRSSLKLFYFVKTFADFAVNNTLTLILLSKVTINYLLLTS
jgi:hypothetical protein